MKTGEMLKEAWRQKSLKVINQELKKINWSGWQCLLGIFLMIAAIPLGLYVGGWWAFVGGIVSILNELKSPDVVSALVIAWGIVKNCIASFIGWASAIICFVIGLGLASEA